MCGFGFTVNGRKIAESVCGLNFFVPMEISNTENEMNDVQSFQGT